MDIKQIKLLVHLMVENDLSELDIADGEAKVRLRRGPTGAVQMAAPAPMAMMGAATAQAAAAPAAPAEAPKAPVSNLIEIKSPMVGTFYAAPSPDSEAYIKIGTAVSDSSVACIIEAMKVMNEIKAECSGTVVEICVKNAQPVEFGQVLFRVKP
ncbi:MAG: acetyl-CoA carboxylase biotin carboxyl carrier protein [Planctomycetaceae bacterium]|nr:acetyl-CoA carboxylase biotin carboxyl carrier protein [Planctomycetaceae bacterium]